MATPPQNGCFAQRFQWPARFCHVLPVGLNSRVRLAALTEPLAACLQAIQRRKLAVPSRRGNDEFELIIGGGAMAMGVLAIRKAQSSANKVAVLARSQADVDFATLLGADCVFRLSRADSLTGEEDAAARLEANANAKRENVDIFRQVRDACGKRVSAAYECTGYGPILEAAIEARVVRGEGCYVGLGCHYSIAFDKAMLRRDEASLMPVRRSKDKFPATLDMLCRQPELFEQLIGSVVAFDDLPSIMKKRGGKSTGTGGPKTVVEFS
jgi:threonine dehydrogenase-like Zn-dependent dehydrogenase